MKPPLFALELSSVHETCLQLAMRQSHRSSSGPQTQPAIFLKEGYIIEVTRPSSKGTRPQSLKMFRKLSLSLRSKNKGKERGVDGTSNGLNGPKGTTHKRAASGLSTQKEVPEAQLDRVASRSEVESSFTQFAHLIHAARRPLPDQSGDGTYLDEKQQHSGLWADLRALGFTDAKTLAEVMKNTVSGALVDDKTMLMERVIQASYILYSKRAFVVNKILAACLGFASSIENPN